MVLEFLFAAGVGAALTGAISEKLDEAKSRRVESLIKKANDIHVQGRCKDAIVLLEEAAKLNPFEPLIYTLMMKAYSRLALEDDNKASRLNAIDMALQCFDAIKWLVGQGVFIPLDALKEYEEANESLRVMRDVTTGKVQVQSKKGEEYQRKADSAGRAGDFKKVLAYITKAIEVETGDIIIAQHHIKRAIAKEALGDYAGAISDCKVALRCERLSDEAREHATSIRDSARSREYDHKSTTAAKAGNPRKALQYITKAIEVAPDDDFLKWYYIQRASIREALGDYDGALSDCKMTLESRGVDEELRKFVKRVQHRVKSAQRTEKTPAKLKSAAGRPSTQTETPAKKTRKRAP